MEKTASGKKTSAGKWVLRIVLILVVLGLLAGGVFAAIGWYNGRPIEHEPDDVTKLNIACDDLFGAYYRGADTSFKGCESYDFLPGPDDTEEQRREKADNATIRDAARFAGLNEDTVSELLKDCVAREDGVILKKERIADYPKDVEVRLKDGVITTKHRDKLILLDIPLNMDTKLGDLFKDGAVSVDRDASILETRQKTLEDMNKT